MATKKPRQPLQPHAIETTTPICLKAAGGTIGTKSATRTCFAATTVFRFHTFLRYHSSNDRPTTSHESAGARYKPPVASSRFFARPIGTPPASCVKAVIGQREPRISCQTPVTPPTPRTQIRVASISRSFLWPDRNNNSKLAQSCRRNDRNTDWRPSSRTLIEAVAGLHYNEASISGDSHAP